MPDGTYSPCLAESWTISQDAKVYEFKLRKGVKFHNGDPLTAEDVIFSFWRYKAGQAKIIHGKTEKVEAVNPHLVRFQFKESFPDFLEYLLPGATSIAWIVPKKYVEKVGDAGFKKHPVGAGPYKFVEFVAGSRMIGEAFTDFWRKVPQIKRMELHIISEPATRLSMTRRGESDISTLMQGVFYEDLKKDQKLRMGLPLSPTRWLVYMTSQWDPKSPWSNAKVRKAASLAIDRKGWRVTPWRWIFHRIPMTRSKPRSCWRKPVIPRAFMGAYIIHTMVRIGHTGSKSLITGRQLEFPLTRD
jgi:peptide/nickel transport system substrate-binding protein